MSDTKISALPSASTLTGVERLPVSQSNQTRGATSVQIRDFVRKTVSGVVADFSADDTSALQVSLTANRSLFIPAGNYKLSSALSLVLYQQIEGEGRSDYLYNSAPSSANVALVRLIQTGSAACLTTGAPASAANLQGRIKITDLVLQGVNNTTVNGIYGVFCSGSSLLMLERVQASFFLTAGFHIGASVDSMLFNCIANYSQDAGLDLTFDTDSQPTQFNAYNALVIGGQYSQCKNANIRLGTSSVGVHIVGVDIESAGNFYPTGTGYGLHVTGEARSCLVENSWFEGNKISIVLGATGSVTTVPVGFVIRNNHFGSVTGGAEQIRINAGKGIVIKDNEFPSGSSIYIAAYAGNPIVENNSGNIKFTNANSDNIAYNDLDVANDFPTPAISSWTLSNCTVAVDTTVLSPGGVIPVYKVTPSATGLVSMTFVGSGLSPFTAGAHHTFGTWIKRGVATEQIIGWQLSTSGGPITYSDFSTVDTHSYTDEWNWISIGRSIPSTDTGNFQLALVTTVATTDVFYLTAMQSKPGIINIPFPEITTAVSSTAPDPGAAGTISTSGLTVSRVNPAAARAGVILQKGFDGQVVTVVNEAAAINTITFAVSGTSFVADGATSVIAGLRSAVFIYDASTSLWYHS